MHHTIHIHTHAHVKKGKQSNIVWIKTKPSQNPSGEWPRFYSQFLFFLPAPLLFCLIEVLLAIVLWSELQAVGHLMWYVSSVYALFIPNCILSILQTKYSWACRSNHFVRELSKPWSPWNWMLNTPRHAKSCYMCTYMERRRNMSLRSVCTVLFCIVL